MSKVRENISSGRSYGQRGVVNPSRKKCGFGDLVEKSFYLSQGLLGLGKT